MKTTAKTNYSLAGIIAMFLISLSSLSLSAQKAYHQNILASLSENFFSNSKAEILHAVTDVNNLREEKDDEILEDWMLTPYDWNNEKPGTKFEEELILEDWMMETNWVDNTPKEEELQLEDWMSQPENWKK
ncbi:MAG: hypothetical protein H6539_03985 [Bacteroidales bacterium]|nr:hypothetical protein [Bacteroidales bacterium]